MKKPLTLAAATVAALCATSAFAASSSSAMLGPLSVQLFDLNPLDGIAPSVTFASSGYDNYSYAYAYQTNPSGSDYQSNYGTTPWADTASSATTSLAWANASLSGAAANGHGATLTAAGAAADFTSPNYYDSASYNANVAAPYYYYYNSFTLSANTALVISAAATVTAAANGHNLYYADYAQANASFNLWGAGPSGSGSQSSYDSASVYGYSYLGQGPWAATDSRTLGASFLNLTSGDMTGNLQVNVGAYGTTYASPVPVPAAVWLMGSGLLGLAGIARRNQQGA